MKLLYFLTDAVKDVPVGPKEEKQPFLVSPTKSHPFLTLRDYFKVISTLICRDDYAVVKNALPDTPDRDDILAGVPKIIIRSEKHGALYHIASAELYLRNASLKLALTSAITPQSRAMLGREYEILRHLNTGPAAACLPEVHGLYEETCRIDGQSETLLIMVGEWLSGFHEWHVTTNDVQKKQPLRLWDQDTGHRNLTARESSELVRQAAYILTTCYAPQSFRQIYPWHHAAGDFVVRGKDDKLKVKLITARNYGPMPDFDPEDTQAPLMSLLTFFVNLSIRMRLDRRDGVAEPVWLHDFAVEATIQGFSKALADKSPEDQKLVGGCESFLELLASFDREELLQICQPLLAIYRHEDEDDLELISNNLETHCSTLARCLKAQNNSSSR